MNGIAHAPFPGRPLAFAQQSRGAGVVAVGEPGTVVGRENHQRVLVETELPQRLQDLPDRPIEFHDDVAVQALLGFPLETIGDVQRHMRHRMGEIQEKRPILVLLDELHGPFRVIVVSFV